MNKRDETGQVSVIIPAYNRGPFIRQTVESVLGQTYGEIELIVVDDGSSDDTRQILEGFGDKIRLLEHPGRANRGQSASINLGLDQAGGEFIAILDSDDYWEPDKIEVQVSYLQEHGSVGLVYGNGFAVDGKGEILYPIYPPGHAEKNRPGDVLMNCYFSLPSNSLFRKAVLKTTGLLDERLRAAQDHDFAIRMAEATTLAYIDKPLFYYRRHAESISTKHADVRWRNGFIILEKARRRYRYPAGVISKRRAVLHFRLFQCLWDNRHLFQALFHLMLSGFYDPARSVRVLIGKEKISSPN